MSRTDHLIGLTEFANSELVRLGFKASQYDTFETAWNGAWPLFKWKRSGITYYEYIFASPWASGPYYFLALWSPQSGSLTWSEWKEEEINEQLYA